MFLQITKEASIKLEQHRQENTNFEFWRIFEPRLWTYYWMKFDEILIRYRVGSLLRACKKPMHLADFLTSNHHRLGKKMFFFIFVFFQLNLMPIDKIALK